MNLLGTELVRDLVSLIQGAEADTTLQVIVFGSADPDYFISHVDVTRISEYREQAAKLTGDASIGSGAGLLRGTVAVVWSRPPFGSVLWQSTGQRIAENSRSMPMI